MGLARNSTLLRQLPGSVPDLYELEAASSRAIDGCRDLLNLFPDHAPAIRAQDNHGHSSAGKILLVAEFPDQQ